MAPKTVIVPPEVVPVLRDCTVEGNVIRLPPQQLPRPIYEATDKVLRAMGGHWNRKAKGHLYPFDPAPFLREALDQGAAVDRKATLQMFETPEDLAARMARKAVRRGDVVLEPSAGLGRLIAASIDAGAKVVRAVELDSAHVLELDRRFKGGRTPVWTTRGDFLTWPTEPVFDAVVMNPPFRGNLDIAHVRHAWGFVRPRGGRLISVMSPHPFFAGERPCQDFRAWVEEIGAEVQELPAKTFASEGTGVGTRLVYAEKA